ncbi:uncharacterized protein LOC135141887 [Zophobas morio]|uniref:uncharacterized protein LOC135141887 n=1 Tax=Zophobas morio TaxID=2755281 RepID=UPI003083B7E6
MALGISAGYQTTSTNALLVVAGMPPIELIVEEMVRRAKKEKRSVEEERHDTVKRWQRLWSQINKGKWTGKLKPEATPWYYRDNGQKNHFLTQLTTGPGDFNQYLHRIGKIPNAMVSVEAK